jgi:hypothetical protein
MITIRKNPNFTSWFQVFAFGRMVDEVKREAKAMRIAKSLAKEAELDYVNVEGTMQKI